MSYFSQGLNTHKVPMSMHANHRQKLLHRFEKISFAADSIILLEGGHEESVYDTDTDKLFRQESFFQYLFGVSEPEFYGAIDLQSKKSILFAPRLPDSYAVWLGEIKPLSHFKEKYEVDEIYFVEEIDNVLQKLNKKTIYTLYGQNSDSGNFSHPATFPGIEKYQVDKAVLHPELCECRVIKTKEEIDLLRYVNKICSEAHIEVMRNCKPGMMEYQLESLFKHYVYINGGCRNMAYVCICASGTHAATLHYGHAAAPNNKDLSQSDMLLLDMGSEYHCYCADITCSFPANGKFTTQQRQIFEAVRQAQINVMNAIRPGVLWPEMHKIAEKTILEHLLQIGLVKGSIDDMLNARVGAIFMPHGLGHFMGLDVHDVGGYPKGIERSSLAGLKSLRTGRVLEENMVLTVEPGCYFIKPVLEAAFQDPKHSPFLVPEEIKKFFNFGGVRLEDDILVTKDGMENLTQCPRTVEEIESIVGSAFAKQ